MQCNCAVICILLLEVKKAERHRKWKQNKQISDGGRWVGDECGLSTGMNSCRSKYKTVRDIWVKEDISQILTVLCRRPFSFQGEKQCSFVKTADVSRLRRKCALVATHHTSVLTIYFPAQRVTDDLTETTLVF